MENDYCFDFERGIYWVDRGYYKSWKNPEYLSAVRSHCRTGYMRPVRDAEGYWLHEVGNNVIHWRHGSDDLEWIMFVVQLLEKHG